MSASENDDVYLQNPTILQFLLNEIESSNVEFRQAVRAIGHSMLVKTCRENGRGCDYAGLYSAPRDNEDGIFDDIEEARFLLSLGCIHDQGRSCEFLADL